MLFVDPCFVTFTILNTNDFVITEHRYGAFITQIFPMIAGWFHLPLSVVLIIYSAAFYIFFSSVVLLLVFYCRQYFLALLMAFYFTLLVSDGYFWPNNEVHQGVGWMFLSFGLLLDSRTNRRWIHLPLALITAFLAVFCHFIVFIPFAFLWLYLFFQKQYWTISKSTAVAGSLVLAGLFFCKYMLGKDGWYDGEKLSGVKNLSWQAVIGAFTSDHAVSIALHFLTNYWIVIIMIIVSIYYLIPKGHWLLLSLYTACMLGYFLLLSITFPAGFGSEMLFYMESQWMAFGIVAATPFVIHFLPQINPYPAAVMVACIFLVRLIYIADASTMFNDRYQALNATVEYLKEHHITKAYLRTDTILKEPFIMDWGLPIETLTLSTLKRHQPPVTLKRVSESEVIPTSTDTFLSSFVKMVPAEINGWYYKPDTGSLYMEVMRHDLFFGH